MKYTATLLFSLILLFNQATAQTFKQQFVDLVSKNDTIGQRNLLQKWEKTDNNDPELYVASFNYYVKKSMKEQIHLGNNPKGKEGFQIMDQDTSKKEPVAFLYGDTYYDRTLLTKGINYIKKGIEQHPSRLDMRFGKVYILGKTENYKDFTNEIIKAIDYSKTIENKWIWADSKVLEKPKEFMLSTIQEYIFQLYNTQNDALLDNMNAISETVLKHYPDHVESLSNISIVYLIKKEYDKALEALLRAEKLAPADYIVLNNIAQAYKLKGDNQNAIKYYEATIKFGDDHARKAAKEQIEVLKNK